QKQEWGSRKASISYRSPTDGSSCPDQLEILSERALTTNIRGVEAVKNTKELQELMYQYTEFLIRLAYYYVKDLQAAEDIVQEVFIKFYNSPSDYEERGELKAFLTKMTVN